jgi:DNA-binding response OmpR family regulator
VADDNLSNLEVLRVRLNAHGYEVITAVDGEDALRRARELEPDLVLLDIMMPRLDGISVLKELKGDTALPFIPVILVTAKADTRDIVSGLEAGADDYLAKPFEQAALVARVRSMLRIKELHDTVQLQAAQLKEQTEQLSSWNRSLEERVTKQVAEIERVLAQSSTPSAARLLNSHQILVQNLAADRDRQKGSKSSLRDPNQGEGLCRDGRRGGAARRPDAKWQSRTRRTAGPRTRQAFSAPPADRRSSGWPAPSKRLRLEARRIDSRIQMASCSDEA